MWLTSQSPVCKNFDYIFEFTNSINLKCKCLRQTLPKAKFSIILKWEGSQRSLDTTVPGRASQSHSAECEVPCAQEGGTEPGSPVQQVPCLQCLSHVGHCSEPCGGPTFTPTNALSRGHRDNQQSTAVGMGSRGQSVDTTDVRELGPQPR